MTTEKRSIEKENTVFNVSAIVVDIEGTTTSINFVKDTLFSYAREHLDEYVNSKWSEKELQDDVILLREQAVKDVADKVEGVVDIPEGEGEDVKKSVIKNVLWQMDGDRKTKSLKQLQGHMWRSGYSSGKLVSHIFDDVKECLKSWSEAGKKIYVYSSGSVEAQKLLFGNTKDGDLLSIFSGFFDTEVGAKTEASSYTKIVEKIKENGHVTSGAKDILFLTDVPKEAQAATDAGMQVAIVIREGNVPLSEETKGSFLTVSSFSDLTFEGNAKRRKLSHESEKVESCDLKSENVEGGNNVAKDEEMEVCTNDNSTSSVCVTANNLDNTSTNAPEPSSVKSEETVEVKTKPVEANSVETAEKTLEPVSKEPTETNTADKKSEETTKPIPDSVNADTGKTDKVKPNCVADSEATSEETSDSANAKSEETCDSTPDSVSNNKETSKEAEKNLEEKSITPADDASKSLSEDVSSSVNPNIENSVESTEETKAKVAEKTDSKDNIAVDNECSTKEAETKQNGPSGNESMVVADGQSDGNKVNVPDSTVVSDDVEMKEVEECDPEKNTKVDEKKPVKVLDNEKSEKVAGSSKKVEEPSIKEETTMKMQIENLSKTDLDIKMQEESCNSSIVEKEVKDPKIENSLPEKKDVENTLVAENPPKEEEKSLPEKQVETSNAEQESKPDVENQMDDKESEKNETSTEKQPDDSAAKIKEVKENQLDNTKKEATNNEVSEMVVNDEGSSNTKKDTSSNDKSENSTSNSAMEVDEKETLPEKSVESAAASESEKKEVTEPETPKESQNGCIEVNSESDNKKESSSVSDDVPNKDEVNKNEIGEKRLDETKEVENAEKNSTNSSNEGLVSEKVDKLVVDKTENKAEHDEKVQEETNDVENNEMKSNGNEETDNIKTDLDNVTPNGTHENCKNGVTEDNITDESSIKEKIKKDSVAGQNGVENAGEV